MVLEDLHMQQPERQIVKSMKDTVSTMDWSKSPQSNYFFWWNGSIDQADVPNRILSGIWVNTTGGPAIPVNWQRKDFAVNYQYER